MNRQRAVEAAARSAVNELASEAAILRRWAIESEAGGWSTHQVDAMRRRADELDTKVFFLRRTLDAAGVRDPNAGVF
ncbi:hypothetical protein ACERK3_09520 [Phycisphaerales bacterium AB-hyl4]|uniref:Uncharacterized protein n=1 Tax=Natronomicrosphaera hydrolytica TaxID=3242702 RepID=A0ABV4U4K3_9BACT